jgi:hypothetical protein
MKTRLVLRPGQRGTQQLYKIYGERLLYVRYRYDSERQLRVKTVELIVDEVHWQPPQATPPPDSIVHVLIAPSEHELRASVQAAGGRWLAGEHLFEMRYDQVVALGLTGRMVRA